MGYITKKDLPQLKIEYVNARNAGATEFEFNGVPVYTDYAKYLIEFLEEKVT